MSLPRWIAVTAVLSLGACASVDAPAPAPVEAPAPAAPQPIAGYDWHLNVSDDEYSLAYGVADTDDVALSLDCTAASRRIHVSRDAVSPTPAEILLESGGDTERLPAQVEESMLTGGHLLSAEIAADAPVMMRFRDLAWLAVWEGDLRKVYVAHPENRDNVGRFFTACG